jgi:DNA-binding winged helix-turn-helix (wHTH) protein
VLNRAQKQLLHNDEAVRLGSRAFDLLDALVERAGTVLSRAELEAHVWPRSVVEETSLRVHMSALRKALGDGLDGVRYIANVPGRGYSFVGDVKALGAPPAGHSVAIDHNLPTRLTREIGRQAIIAEVTCRLGQWRLVSIVGSGGMGKTTVALAVAERVLQSYPDGVFFVDLAALSEPAHVPQCLATALGLLLPPGDVAAGLCACLRGRHVLLVLDNCEHVVDAIATLAERMLEAAPRLSLIATSREPLAVAGEWVSRIGGLAAPLADSAPTLAEAMAFPAVQLFVERSLANADANLMSDANCALITHLCRRLDGMPLAIELAAGCMDSLGPRGLAERLDQMFELLTRGRRSALPRQHTLQALLDWSHRLLSKSACGQRPWLPISLRTCWRRRRRR